MLRQLETHSKFKERNVLRNISKLLQHRLLVKGQSVCTQIILNNDIKVAMFEITFPIRNSGLSSVKSEITKSLMNVL